MKANNNPKNRKGLLEYQRRQLELAELTEADSRKRRIQANLEKWVETLTPTLKLAKPSALPKKTLESLRITRLEPPYKNVIITSAEITSATFVAYSLLYTLVRGGFVTPSQIKKTNLLDGYNNINGIFNSRKWKDYFFDPEAKVLLVEGASKYLTRLGSKGEDQFWRELIEFTKNHEKLVIVTYSTEKEETINGTFIPSLTSEPELNRRLLKTSSYVFINEEEEKEIRNEQAKTH